ncbi:alpha/beta hydrolase family protein [Campylobacter avium LMG 24591]|uniref:Alpha/beta hydrolase family protein n=1 Tax=Campylobacter avium LMG 24591 TaxID=522484 RepID=A0A222MVL3_9BACT|nr:alpha/beta hydrolase [Campylobacter avium]ASQ29841.1 alpha/beta hydrolase family protein [Campylobacter avium LMG 24591]OYD78940.1 alpha/beta hydrolase family protein [Campylobacter avium]
MKKLGLYLTVFYVFAIAFIQVEASELKKLYVVHGFGSNSSSHWFKWLKTELENDNSELEVKILDLPNSTNPKPNEWLSTIKENVGKVDENTYFVAHSLGCISTLIYLNSLDDNTKIGGFVFVGGFYEPLDILPQLRAFTSISLNFNKLQKMTNKGFVLSAKDDKIVPTKLSENLANKLKAKFIQTQSGGHFGDKKTVEKVPVLLDIIQENLGI